MLSEVRTSDDIFKEKRQLPLLANAAFFVLLLKYSWKQKKNIRGCLWGCQSLFLRPLPKETDLMLVDGAPRPELERGRRNGLSAFIDFRYSSKVSRRCDDMEHVRIGGKTRVFSIVNRLNFPSMLTRSCWITAAFLALARAFFLSYFIWIPESFLCRLASLTLSVFALRRKSRENLDFPLYANAFSNLLDNPRLCSLRPSNVLWLWYRWQSAAIFVHPCACMHYFHIWQFELHV